MHARALTARKSIDEIVASGEGEGHQLSKTLGLSSITAMGIGGQSRIFYTMSQDGLLPAFFSKIHPRYETPYPR